MIVSTGNSKNSHSALYITALTIILLCSNAGAASLVMSIDNPAVTAYPSNTDNVLYIGGDQNSFDIPLENNFSDIAANPHRFYVIPRDGAFLQTIVLRFRLNNISLSGAPVSSNFRATGTSILTDINSTITNYFASASSGWVEFTFTLEGAALTWATNYQVDLSLVPYSKYARLIFSFKSPYEIEEYNLDTGPTDEWFRLARNIFPDSFINGGPLPKIMETIGEPVVGEIIEVTGSNIVFSPTTATSDSDGVFGIFAHLDPGAFSAATPKMSRLERNVAGSQNGSLSLKYKGKTITKALTGKFCQVIMLKGTVRLVGGSGTVKTGDILLPGDRLSLGASWGQQAQIGLRFFNGGSTKLVQDVFTNACLTDDIIIGSDGIENNSVIQGKSVFMTVSRNLCEAIGGMPNTPSEWGVTAGKFVVKSASSAIVTTTGPMGYVVKYAVKSVAGRTYDYLIPTSGSGGNRFKLNRLFKGSTSDKRIQIDLYHEGSSRISQNLEDFIMVYDDVVGSTAFTSVSQFEWQEFLGAGTLGREFIQTVDSIDQTGPDLQIAFSYYAPSALTTYDILADDISGMNDLTFSALIDGNDTTSSFYKIAEGVWQAKLVGGTPYASTLSVTLSDNVGNSSTLDWSYDSAPGQVNITSTTPGLINEETLVEWDAPDGMGVGDISFYEIRLIWPDGQNRPWQSVGPATNAGVLLPTYADSITAFYIDIRANDATGRTGSVARTNALYAIEDNIFANGFENPPTP